MPLEHDALLLDYLDGRLSPRELGRLDERLVQDPDLARRLAELSWNEAMLVELPEASRSTVRRRPQTSPGSRRRTAIVAAAAAVFIGLLLWALAESGGEAPTRPVAHRAPEDAREELRPVSRTPEVENARSAKVLTPAVALLLIVDKSGSMAGRNIEIVKETCIAAARALSKRDLFGVVAFDHRPYSILEFTEAERIDDITQRILRLGADGGTRIRPALEMAERMFELDARARRCSIKHAILLSDGDAPPADNESVVRRMAEAGITVSTVCVSGAKFDAVLMSQIATWGKGRFYFTPSFEKVRQLIENETQNVIAMLPKDDQNAPPPAPAPKTPEAPPLPVSAPSPELAKPPPTAPPAPRSPETEMPKTASAPPPRIVPEPPAPPRVPAASVRGTLALVRAGQAELLDGRGEIRADDVLSTGPRRGASFTVEPRVQCWLDRSTSVALDRDERGALRVRLLGGAVFLRTADPVLISGAAGDVTTEGAAVGIELEKGRLQILVLEGQALARGPKGEQAVRAGQRSTLRAGEKPSPAAKADVEAATAWTRSPVLAALPPEGPFLEREPGGNRRLSGLVVAAPFSDGEELSGRMARAVAEAGDLALVLGHGYRDPKRGLWINVDRGMEGDVAADGTASNERFTDRARKFTAEYLDQCRSASGAAGREPVPVLLQFRTHYLKQGGAPVDVAEVAWSGWNKATLAQMKALYAQLLEKQKPGVRLELKVQGLDDPYDWRGTRRKFSLGDEDAREEGYLAPRNSRNALTVFLPDGFARGPGELAAYAKIFGDLAEFLSSRRR